MGRQGFFDNIIEEKLMSLHTAYIAKVLSVKGNAATVQPMAMIKQYGKPAEKAKVISDVPILSNAQYKFSTKEIQYIPSATANSRTQKLIEPVPISAGDLVLCVCCERDITEARRGNIATPQIGHHSLSDSIIIGIL